VALVDRDKFSAEAEADDRDVNFFAHGMDGEKLRVAG